MYKYSENENRVAKGLLLTRARGCKLDGLSDSDLKQGIVRVIPAEVAEPEWSHHVMLLKNQIKTMEELLIIKDSIIENLKGKIEVLSK